ncbi:MAG: hypothetical protein QF492_00710 [Candidatus Krumholzibacteria bacterium]|jgi:tetratricopeptide (TPR) repeat protein|nr:hypothetical protein [Candidatus Krumholzibacteria bacterium]MDP6668413.1 hypothetical protein [Candidatus Krumholzibacteria bacterium]MDP6797982.1 hypothetical protein [Candidatus Krumholzibacteria bacterium]MDP7021863.1 hypothetical protein [Candidatus Krumholzibacteria bacterium]
MIFSSTTKIRQPVAPGIIRLSIPVREPSSLEAPGGAPLSLTLREKENRHGILAPAGKTPWGCLFFALFGLAILIAVASTKLALLYVLLALIAYFSAYRHPRRQAGEFLSIALAHLATRKSAEAQAACSEAFELLPDNEGLNWIFALSLAQSEQWDKSLEHLDLSRSSFDRYAEYHHLRAELLEKLGRAEEAAESLKTLDEFEVFPLRKENPKINGN